MPLATTVLVVEEGFSYQWYSENGKVRHEGFVGWSEIESIDAYKRDLFAYDLICIDLRCSEFPDRRLEIDEDDLAEVAAAVDPPHEDNFFACVGEAQYPAHVSSPKIA